MELEILMGKHVFLGSERLAEAIYQHISVGNSLTDLERGLLLRYLRLQVPDEARRAYGSADDSARKDALKAVMAKFPKEWPPPARAP